MPGKWKWEVSGVLKNPLTPGTFRTTVEADTLREAVELVEKEIPGSSVATIAQRVPYVRD